MDRIIRKLRKVLPSVIILIIILLAFFTYPLKSFATTVGETGLLETAGEAFKSGIPFEKDSPATVIGSVVGALLAFIGVLFFILMIYGGLLWMTARGNEQQVSKAKDLIIAAIIGLVIVLAAYAITAYIGSILGQTSRQSTP